MRLAVFRPASLPTHHILGQTQGQHHTLLQNDQNPDPTDRQYQTNKNQDISAPLFHLPKSNERDSTCMMQIKAECAIPSRRPCSGFEHDFRLFGWVSHLLCPRPSSWQRTSSKARGRRGLQKNHQRNKHQPRTASPGGCQRWKESMRTCLLPI